MAKRILLVIVVLAALGGAYALIVPREDPAAALTPSGDEGQSEGSSARPVVPVEARWATLPPEVESIAIDGQGVPWIQMPVPAEMPAIEAMSASLASPGSGGPGRLIRGGRYLMTDTAGGIFARSDTELYYFDGSTLNRAPQIQGALRESQWIDSKGNLWLIEDREADGTFVHRVGRDGKRWETLPLPPPIVPDAKEPRLRQPRLVETADGAIILGSFNEWDSEGDETHESASIFRLEREGSAFVRTVPRMCNGSRIRNTIVFPDGSYGTVCTEGYLALYKPVDEKRIAGILRDVESDDPGRRDSAFIRLSGLPLEVRDPIIQKLRESGLAETQARLDALAKSLKGGGYSRCRHSITVPYLQRHEFGRCHVLYQGQDGRVILGVQNYTDLRSGKKSAQALITIDATGWWVKFLPAELDLQELDGKSADHYLDSQDRLWLSPALRIEPDGRITRILDGDDPGHVFGEDASGRMLFEIAGRAWIYDERAAPPSAGVVPSERWTYRWTAQYGTDGSVWAWLGDGDGRLHRFLDGRWQELPGAPVGRGQAFVPLHNGAMIVVMSRGEHRAALFDGQQWHVALNYERLVEENVQRLLPLARFAFLGGAQYGVVVDDAGVLWALGKRSLRCSDGARMVDVAAQLLNQEPPAREAIVPLRTAKGGGLLMTNREKTQLHHLNVIDGEVVMQQVWEDPLAASHPKLSKEELSASFGRPLASPEGDLWMRLAGDGDRVLHFRDGQARILEGLRPQRLDPQGRLVWSRDKTLAIRQADGTMVEVVTEDRQLSHRVAQSADGSYWIVGCAQLQRYVLDPSGNLRLTGQWAWPQPQVGWSEPFCDSAGGLWLANDGTELVRLALPQ